MITPKRPGITPSRIFVAGLAALSLLVLAACSSSVVREGGSRVSTPKYGATAVVKRGDNLYRIATNNGITTLDLATWNDIDPPYTIYPGQRLRLYPGDGRRSAARPASSTAATKRPASSTRPPVSTPPPAAASRPSRWRWPTEGPTLRPSPPPPPH